MNDLLKRLGMDPISPLFDNCYEAVQEETGIPEWLTEAFLLETLEEFPFITGNRELVLAALPELVKKPDHILFARVLHRMLGLRKHQKEVFGRLRFPKDFGLSPIFPLLARSREAYEALRHKGADEDILQTTAARMDGSLSDSIRIAGKPVLSVHYFLWLTVHSNGTLFAVGRFELEVRDPCRQNVRAFQNQDGATVLLMDSGLQIHKNGLILGSGGCMDAEGAFETRYLETEDDFQGHPVENGLVQRQIRRLDKKAWTCLYAPGDPLISVHIPSKGSFDPDTVASSLRRGAELIRKLYPEKHFRGFLCMSWLLSPELSGLLKPDSNILRFGSLYARYPVASKGMDIFRFVFQRDVTDLTVVDWDALPQETSLAKALVPYYQSGHFVHETGGLILFADTI